MIDRRAIFRELASLSWPIIGLNVLNVLALLVDTAMCGRLPDAEVALTALGFATQMVFLLLVAMMGLTVGTVALVARAHGAKDVDRVNHVLLQSTQLTVLLGIALGALGLLFAGDLLALLGADGAALEDGEAYLQPLLVATAFYYLTILYAGVLRGVGNTRIPFLVALFANGLNVVLNYGLILGNFGLPAMGVRGAAIGTAISQVVSVVLLVAIIRRGTVRGLSLPLVPRAIDGALTRTLFRIGAPAAADMVILNAAFLSIVGLLGHLDDVAVAAHGIGLRIQALAFVPGMSVAQATGALVGKALGGGDTAHARAVLRASLVLSTAIMTVLAALIIFAVDPLVALFDVPAGTDLERYTVLWIRLLGYGMPVVGVHIAFVGMLQGAGATNTSLGINTVGTLVFQIPASVLLGLTAGLGAFGVWVAFPLSFVVKAALGWVAYRRGAWAKVGATV